MSLSAGVAPIPSVDFRASWPVVRDQGDRASCLACSSSDAHSFAQPLLHLLSAEYLFYSASLYMQQFDAQSGLTISAAQAALTTDGQPHEAEWPLLKWQPPTWMPPPSITTLWRAKLVLGTGANPQDVVAQLKAGTPVVMVIRLTADFYEATPKSEKISTAGPAFGSHAVLAVGLGTDGVDDCILIRNSWGPTWRSNGHAWLPIDYLASKLVSHATVVAIPQ